MLHLPLLLLSALPTLIHAQTVSLLTGAINKTLSDGVTLFTKISTFEGSPDTGLLDAVKIVAAAYDVQKDILAADQIVQKIQNFTDTESIQVSTSVIGLVSPIKLLLKTIVTKKPAFQAVKLGLDDLTPQVLGVLQKTKSGALSLGQNIVSRLSGAIKDAAPALLKDIEIAFDTAIAAYSVD